MPDLSIELIATVLGVLFALIGTLWAGWNPIMLKIAELIRKTKPVRKESDEALTALANMFENRTEANIRTALKESKDVYEAIKALK